jgi:hypothetical protein
LFFLVSKVINGSDRIGLNRIQPDLIAGWPLTSVAEFYPSSDLIGINRIQPDSTEPRVQFDVRKVTTEPVSVVTFLHRFPVSVVRFRYLGDNRKRLGFVPNNY